MENIRHWYLQKPKEHNRPHNDNVAVFQEFKPTVGYDGFEWIKVISLDDFHKESGINITKYISMAKELKKIKAEDKLLTKLLKDHCVGKIRAVDQYFNLI